MPYTRNARYLGQRVRIEVRPSHPRKYVEGILRVIDPHMNVILADATETRYMPSKTRNTPENELPRSPSEENSASPHHWLNPRTRVLGLTFIRGSEVMSLSESLEKSEDEHKERPERIEARKDFSSDPSTNVSNFV